MPIAVPRQPKKHPVIVKSRDGITLLGGGAVALGDFATSLRIAPCLVAADGGANRLLNPRFAAFGAAPRAVLGDMDSLSAPARQAFSAVIHPIPAQDDTDFDKALAAINAPFVLALGFVGARMDHGLAVLSGLLRRPDLPCFLLGGRDVIFLAPPKLALNLPRGARVSLFPMGVVHGRSTGLQWPIDGIEFAPDGAIGTSNRSLDGTVSLEFSARKMLVILARAHLPQALAAFGLAPPEPVRAE